MTRIPCSGRGPAGLSSDLCGRVAIRRRLYRQAGAPKPLEKSWHQRHRSHASRPRWTTVIDFRARSTIQNSIAPLARQSDASSCSLRGELDGDLTSNTKSGAPWRLSSDRRRPHARPRLPQHPPPADQIPPRAGTRFPRRSRSLVMRLRAGAPAAL